MSTDKPTRGRRSNVHLLPDSVKAELDKLLRDGRMTQQDILAQVNELAEAAGAKGLSRSGLNRYSTKMEQMGSRIREAREVSDAWVAKLGTEPSGDVSQLLIEMVRTLAFDSVLQHAESGEPLEPKLIKELSIGIEKLEKAAETSQKREIELRKQFAEQAADAAETAAKAAGMTKAGAEAIKREILGIA